MENHTFPESKRKREFTRITMRVRDEVEQQDLWRKGSKVGIG